MTQRISAALRHEQINPARKRKEMEGIHRIGVMTAGGDCPGLNAVIRAVAKTAMGSYGWEVMGIEDGFLGLIQNRMRLLNQLVPLMDDDKAFAEVVDQHRAELDYEFLLVISSLIDASAAEGNTETVATLETLRDKILTLVEIAGPRQAPPNATAEELIELLLAGSKENNWRSYIALNRARLDYAFFQVLTGQIEAAQAAEDSQRAQELTELRDKILQELDVQESMLRSVEDQAVLRIMDLLDAPDLAAALREQRRNLDEVMLSTVARLRAEAVRSKRDERAAQLQAILDGALELLEADLPPAARLINQLMRASYPDGTNQLLEEHRAGLTDELVAMVDQYIDNLERVNRAEQAAHLKQVRDQITAKRLILR